MGVGQVLRRYLPLTVFVAAVCLSVLVLNLWQGVPEYTVSFTSSTDSPTAWDTIVFTDNSTGNPISWDWDFGDGTTSTGEDVAHVYENSGTYMITLTVTYGDGTQKTISRQITVAALEVYPDSVMAILAMRRIEYSLWYTPSLEGVNDPLIENAISKHKIFIMKKRISLYYGPHEIIAVNRYDGRTFILFGVLEDQFNKMIEAEEISVNENVALNLSKAHVKLQSYSSATWVFDEPLYLQSASDIPWSEDSRGADPREHENVVEPPQVTQVGENYQVEFYTWNETYGIIGKWTYEVGSDGQLVYQQQEIASGVGDYYVPVTLAGMPSSTLIEDRKHIASTSITITGTADPNITIKVEVSIDNGVTWAEQTGARTTADNDGNWRTTIALTEGVITGIAFRAIGSENNESAKVLFGYVQADVHPPVLAITSPADGTVTNQENVLIIGTVARDTWEDWGNLTLTVQVGTDNVVVPINPDGSFTHSVTLKEGTNTVTVSVTDGVNLPSTNSFTITRAVIPWWLFVFGIAVVLFGIVYLITGRSGR